MFVALLLAAIICVPLCSVRAVSNGELELDGQMEEYDIWDFSHNVALYETGILSAPVAVTYADLKYLIDDNRKTLYLYIRLIDETPPSDGACGVCLSLADGNMIRLDEDVRPSAPTCAQVSYYALELRDTEMIFEAQIDFYTIAEAKEALESLSVSVFDRRGRETQGYCFTPVFPVQPGETQSVPAAAESTDRDEKETDSRRESTTKKPSTTRDKSTTRKSGKSSSRDPEDPEEEETEEEALDHTVS